MTISALVVDDEAVARRRIIRLLGERDDVRLVGECSGGLAAVQAIETLTPQLVFLDVQMPDIDGFEVLRRVDLEDLPAVIFVTAYDQYALRAFDASAVDYLLKPYSAERFGQAVTRAMGWVIGDRRGDERRLKLLLADLLRSEERRHDDDTGSGRLDRFLVKRRGVGQFIKAVDVDWFEADGNYVRLHVGTSSHLVRGTISACAERLDQRQFVRIHRRFIVNMDRVKELQPWMGGDYIVLMQDGRKLRLSRNYREQFRTRMLGD
jgi:two-component system, LytTR family, response regulator